MGFVELESYYMKIEEVNLLLAGLDIPFIFGIAFSKNVILKSEEMNRILISLYQKMVIDWEEDKIAVKQPFADIFAVISESRKCVVINGGSGKYPIRCCYLAENKVVMTEKSQREERMLCISYLAWKEWISYIEEYLHVERMCANESVKLLLELKDSRTGMEYGSITILEQGLQTYLIKKFAGEEESIPYEREVLKRKLEEWLWEVEA